VDRAQLQVKANFQIQERGGTACFFAQAAKIKVDPETGKVTILKMLSAHDTGTVINPITYQGHIEGGMMQDLEFALMENRATKKAKSSRPAWANTRSRAPPIKTLLP
jgi:CO/xanthine dehydrogenase Mo-binding subunit